MKTFKDLKPGDYIYYYDHGRLHKQLVYECNIETKVNEYHDYFGNKHTYEDTYLIITCGNNCLYKISQYDMDCSETYFNYLRRFSCEEAGQSFIESLKNRYERKIDILTNKLNKEKNKLLKLI